MQTIKKILSWIGIEVPFFFLGLAIGGLFDFFWWALAATQLVLMAIFGKNLEKHFKEWVHIEQGKDVTKYLTKQFWKIDDLEKRLKALEDEAIVKNKWKIRPQWYVELQRAIMKLESEKK